IRVVTADGTPLQETRRAPDLGPPQEGTITVGGYRVAARIVRLPIGYVFVQYARRLSDVDATVARVRLFLIFGVLAGTAIAFAGGLMLARRSMRPLAQLAAPAREIAQTRDPRRPGAGPDTGDGGAELARTPDGMPRALE